jgi:hypothetical protein
LQKENLCEVVLVLVLVLGVLGFDELCRFSSTTQKEKCSRPESKIFS